jgi:hypothetical protein
VAILPGGIQASVLTSLQIAPGATLDISDNALVLDYSGDSPLAGVREQIFSGRGQAGFGASWSGAGITSSSSTQINLSEPESRSVGYAENALLPLGPYSSFHEVGVDSTAVLIAYTRTGDANLDALVDDNDVTIFGATYEPGVSRPHWALGDFDYNGFIDDDDVTLLGVFYNSVSGAPPLPPARTDFAHRNQVAKERTALHHVTTYISLTANATVEGRPVDALDKRRLALPRTRNRLGR